MATSNQPASSTVFTVDQARVALIAAITPSQQTETVELHESLSRVSARDIHAVQDIPPFRNSAMDGYALRQSDTLSTNRFTVAGTSLAGHPYSGDVAEHCAIKITTGAFVPPSTDSIVIVENTTRDGSDVLINKPPRAHQYIRNAGDDTKRGTLLVAANKQLAPSDLGLLAAQGITKVDVIKQPRIGVFSTGDELCSSGQKLAHGQIYDSNRITIQSLLKKAGFASIDLGIAKDSEKDIQRVLEDGSDCDFLLSSGGVSVGEADFVKSVLEANGELHFWKVAMKPGKPMVTGKLTGGTHYIGLPGNPVSSVVTCVQFVIPAIRAFCGQPFKPPAQLKAICQTTLTKETGRYEFQRGVATTGEDGKLTVSTTGLQDSHVLTSISRANCFICLDSESSGAAIGSTVKVIMFDSIHGL